MWSCFGNHEFKWIHAWHNYIMFFHFKIIFWTIGMPLGYDFMKWSSSHDVLWVSKYFPEFWPKILSFEVFSLSWKRRDQIWKFQNLNSLSSVGVHAWARTLNTCTSAWPTLFRLSVKCMYPEVHVFCSMRERQKAYSSEGLNLTLKRRSSVHRAWNSSSQ